MIRAKGLFHKEVKEAEGRGSLEGHEGLGLGSGMVAVPWDWSCYTAGPAPMWPTAEMTSHGGPHRHQLSEGQVSYCKSNTHGRSAILLTAEKLGSAGS